ncbi:MAG: hypothetical protein E7Z76_06270 [Methanobrevibacter sp.]|nr:hypothetical protein [Methanobrevibacter sp.]
MKLNKWGKIVWFIVAYSPLYFALLIKFYFLSHLDYFATIEIIFLGLITLAIFLRFFISILTYNEDTNPRPEKCIITQSKNSEYVLFVVSYLIPFYNISFTVADIVPTIFMLILIGFLYIRTPLFAVNPILNLLGYNLYNAKKDKDKKEILLITKQKLVLDCYNIKLTKLNEDIYISNKIKECK